MADDWMTGVTRVPSTHNGGTMLGGLPRFVWHTFECGYNVSALAGARSLIVAGNEVHFVFHPVTGDLVQILPASVAGRGLVNAAGGVQTNRLGTVCLQVEVIARAASPLTSDLTDAGRATLARLVAFADSHYIPRVWPAGPPPSYPGDHDPRSTVAWSRAGHFGHSQVPENSHGDPGAIRVADLFAAPTPDAPKEWDEMATKDEIAAVVRQEIAAACADGGVIEQRLDAHTTFELDNLKATVGRQIAAQSAQLAAYAAAAQQGGTTDKAVIQAAADKAVDEFVQRLNGANTTTTTGA